MNASWMRKIIELFLFVTLGYWTSLIKGVTKTLVIGALIGGCLLLLYFGGRSPEWMLKGEVLIVLTFALVYGFTAFTPRLPDWLKYQEVRGVCCVAMGCVALFVPAQFLVSSCLIGIGAKLVMTSNRVTVRLKPGGAYIARVKGDIVPRESGEVITH